MKSCSRKSEKSTYENFGKSIERVVVIRCNVLATFVNLQRKALFKKKKKTSNVDE